MAGMSATTGKYIEGVEHLKQSIRDILTTPIGTRVMRRNYGSRLMYLVDRPFNAALVADIQAAVVESITAYEPRFRISRVQVNGSDEGKVNLTLEGYYLPENQVITLENIII